MYSEKRNVLQLLALLKAHHINKFVISPGSRHIPMVISMEADSFFKLYSVVDERSASFFALGLIQRFNEPVGIMCTSGTAAANYCSAISEAYYQELPLLVLSADRIPMLLDQHEDQMIHQSTMYTNITRMVANLPVVNSDKDAWYNNRLINEALLELNHHGRGPVQINVPVENHLDSFTTSELPAERVIERFDLSYSINFWNELADGLVGKKIIVVCGEGMPLNENEKKVMERFTRMFDCIVLSDKISNCHVYHSVQNSFPVLQAMSQNDVKETAPDIIISMRANYAFNPEFKNFVKRAKPYSKIENWYLSPSGKVADPFHLLTKVFEMDAFRFFEEVTKAVSVDLPDQSFADTWSFISSVIEEPDMPYSHIYTIGKFLKSLPENAILHLANSNSVRMAQLFHIPDSVEVYCNRGTDGIDGCMSTMVGFASETNKMVYLMIGDLTFFYDMNALWNRQLGKNIRIILNNNGGGAIMHMPNRPDFAAKLLPNYISAQHNASARAWVEDRGFSYFSASNEQELESGIKQLHNPDIEGPVILEVFTDMLKDTQIFKGYYAQIKRTTLDKKLIGKAKGLKRRVYTILGLK